MIDGTFRYSGDTAHQNLFVRFQLKANILEENFIEESTH